jgi:glycosyltransferase involved in cell wall biosynthesis
VCRTPAHPRWAQEPLDERGEWGGHVRAGYTHATLDGLLQPLGFERTATAGVGGSALALADQWLQRMRGSVGDLGAVPVALPLLSLVSARFGPAEGAVLRVRALQESGVCTGVIAAVKITVSSPDLRPSLIAPLQGLAAAGALERVITTLAFARDGKALTRCRTLVPESASLLRRRIIPDGLEPLVECIPLGELLMQASGRLGLGDRAQHRVWMWAEPYFDRKVAERLGGAPGVLYGHEHASLASFESQKRAGGRCVLRQVNAHYQFLDAIVDEEHSRFGAPDSPGWRAVVDSRARVNARKAAEYQLADLIVANSGFVRRTFIDAGVPGEPSGGNSRLDVRYRSRTPPEPATRRRLVLCAGHLSFRKGTLYLIEAWRRLRLPPAEAELVLAGRAMLPPRLLANLPPGVRLTGTVSAAALDRLYREASLFVLPTLCEGLAHVIPEALSRGLPVLTTPHSGADDFIASGVNGWIVPIRDSDALADRIMRALGPSDRSRGDARGGASGRRRRERMPAPSRRTWHCCPSSRINRRRCTRKSKTSGGQTRVRRRNASGTLEPSSQPLPVLRIEPPSAAAAEAIAD